MEVPQGFEKFYPKNTVLLLLKTIYGLKQAALAFWRELLKALRCMKYGRSKADPCLYFRWTVCGLILWLLWVNGCLVAGKKEGVLQAKDSMMELFDCDDVGELNEYVRCKVDYDQEAGTMKLTQPVMIQSFKDEFELPEGKASNTPAIPGTVMSEGEIKNQVNVKAQSLYRVMKYRRSTPNRGSLLKPTVKWDGSPKMLFEIVGYSDSDWAKDPDTRRSVSRWYTFLFDAPISMKSKMMPIVALSVTQAELFAATCCAQDMLFEMRVLEPIGLKVKKPMFLKVDNK
jgi:hypothetical protein